MEKDNDRAVFAGANKVMSLVNRMQQMKQYAADQARKAEEQELQNKNKNMQQTASKGDNDTRGLIVGGLGVLARFAGLEIDRTAQNAQAAQEQQAKQQMQVNQANTEAVTDVNANTQQASGTSIASPVQEQVSNAIGLRRNNDVDPSLVQGMIPAKGTQLEAERDRASAKILKQYTVQLGAAPDATKVNESYAIPRGILNKMAHDKETEFGTNPLTRLFYDLFMAPGQLALVDRNIELYQQANQQYSTEAELYAKKLQYNKDLYEQYMKGKTEYFKNAMQDSMIAKSGTNYTDTYDYKAQAIGTQFDTIHKERLGYLHKRGEDLHKLFDEGKPIGIDGTKSLIARLTNDGDTGQLLLADVGSLYSRLVEHDENFDFATHQLVDTLKGKGYNNAALDTAKIIANNDMLKAKIRALNAANQAGVAGKGAFVFWKSEFSPQMVAEVCNALDAFDGYQELSRQYALGLAKKAQMNVVQYTDALEHTQAVTERYGVNEAAAFGASITQNDAIVAEQVDSRTVTCQKIIDDPRSTPEEKYYAYVSMTGSPERVPDEITADMLMTAPLREMAMPFNQAVAKEALLKTQDMLLPMLSNSSIQNASKSVLSDLLMKLVDADASFRQQAMTSFKVDSVAKISSAINDLKDSELQERVFQLKHSREFKQAVMNLMRNAVQTATITDSTGKVVNTNGNAGLAIVDNYVLKTLEQEMLQSRVNNIPLEPAAFTAALKARINRQISNNIFYSVVKFDQNKIDKMVEQHWDSTAANITASMQRAQNNAVASAIAAKQK